MKNIFWRELTVKNDIVYWTIHYDLSEFHNKDLYYFEPESAFKQIVGSRSKTTNFLKCPAFMEYYKNTYLIRCPVDCCISFGDTVSMTPDIGLFNAYHTNEIDTFSFYQLQINYTFYSKSDIEMEILPLNFNPKLAIGVIPGSFNISKWIRPVSFGFEVYDKTTPLVFKRGEPLYYVRFRSKSKLPIKMERKEFDINIFDISSSCSSLKNVIQNNSLQENYEMAKWKIQNFWKKIGK